MTLAHIRRPWEKNFLQQLRELVSVEKYGTNLMSSADVKLNICDDKTTTKQAQNLDCRRYIIT